MTNRRQAKAEALLEDLGICEPEDIDLEAIAFYCGATIVYEPMNGCEARLLGRGDRAIITVNSRCNRGRQRFSGAHEVGHWLYDRGEVALACTGEAMTSHWGKSGIETRANRFAADLLLPPRLFTPAAARLPITFESARLLADRFETSLSATVIRLVQFGSFPSMVILHTKVGRKWFIPAPELRDLLWPVRRATKGSAAWELLNGRDDVLPGRIVPADIWIDRADARSYEVREESILVRRGLVLTLLWWEDEAQVTDALEGV